MVVDETCMAIDHHKEKKSNNIKDIYIHIPAVGRGFEGKRAQARAELGIWLLLRSLCLVSVTISP